MMRQMRENTKWIMLVTVLAFAALMVFEWGMDLTGQSGAQMAGGELGRVNGEIVSYEEWQAVYRNLYQQQQSQAAGPLSAAMNRQIEDAAWEQVVVQRLLTQELRRRGIRVTDAEIREAAMSAPPPELLSAPAFQTEGEFDVTKYQQFLASPSLDDQFLRQLEAYYRDVIPRSKLYFQNTAGIYVSDEQLWRMYRDMTETATVQYVAFNPDVIVAASDVTVSDRAIRDYYNANRDDFVRPAQATVRFVAIPRTPTAADSAATRQAVEAYRAALIGGRSFDEVAQEAAQSDNPSLTGGQPVSIGRGQSAPAVDRAIFATAAGQVAPLAQSGAGYHVIRVESRGADSASIRQLVFPVTLSEDTEVALLARADSLDRLAVNGLDQAASRMGLTVQTSELTPVLPVLPGVGSIDDGMVWALEEAEIGEPSEVFEGDESFYVLELVTRRDEGVLTIQEATPTIRALLERRERLNRARQLLVDAERRAHAGESLDRLAADYNSTVGQAGPFGRGDFVAGLGRMNAAVGAAFGLAPGQVSPLVEAEGELFLLRGVSRTTADRTEWQAQLEQQRARVLQASADTRWSQFMRALRENAEVVDNRRQLLRRGAATS
jgi:peptidyl-prolyl cis-trans isomerase D